MKIFLITLFTVALLYLIVKVTSKGKKDSKQINMGDPSTISSHNSLGNRSHLSMIAEIASKPTVDLGQVRRYDPASDRQVAAIEDMFSEVDISAPKGLTRGQASDIIGLFHEPDDDEIAFLKYFKVPNLSSMYKTQCRWKFHELLSDPDNAKAWEGRPASTEQKDEIRYMGGKISRGLTSRDSDALIIKLTEATPEKSDEYSELRDEYDYLVDPDTRDMYDLKKFSWSQYRKAVDVLVSQGTKITEIIDDEDTVVEELVKLYPKLLKG